MGPAKDWHCSYCSPCGEVFDLIVVQDAEKKLKDAKHRDAQPGCIAKIEEELKQAKIKHRAELHNSRRHAKWCRRQYYKRTKNEPSQN